LFACRESHFSAYLTLWFPLLIWWTPLCLIRQILTRRFRLYAYQFARVARKSGKQLIVAVREQDMKKMVAEFGRIIKIH
ncbi:hypothetical protein MZC05_24240, partial [Escherichia coli]|nr:hypothetical protein [Escherichia coli]MCQ5747928.1 hypothetical protein [Escherichia coli]MCQ5762262.1 hypothetical protein [Escherichia coli]MCQ5786789.1 hypothetical protein [Escherichia coli]